MKTLGRRTKGTKQRVMFDTSRSGDCEHCQREGLASSSEQIECLRAEVDALSSKLDEVCSLLSELKLDSQEEPRKEAYTTGEVATILGRKPYTVREWCRLGRVNAFKAECGRGIDEEWRIEHEELARIRNEGLLRSRHV
jgi:hypothetical protein